jgi:hypothetical protein
MKPPWDNPENWATATTRGEAYGMGWADCEERHRELVASLKEATELLSLFGGARAPGASSVPETRRFDAWMKAKAALTKAGVKP